MKRTLVMVAAVALASGVVWAGEFHFGDTLTCSQCHTMHASLQHSYGGTSSGFPQTWTPTKYLLKGPENEMCLSCHNDASFAPDVLGDDTGPMRANRSAGALNELTGVDDYDEWMGHTLGSTQAAPGDTGAFEPDDTAGLLCVDCHQQHGHVGTATDVAGNPIDAVKGSFRNVRTLNGKSVSYAIGTNDLTVDVYETSGRNYNTSGVQLNEPNIADSGWGTWCQECHTNFHGTVGDPASIGGNMDANPAEFVRHPNAGVNIGAIGRGHSSLGVFSNRLYRVRVMSATGDWGTQGTAWATAPDDLTPTCLSCHKAHGTKRAFGLIYAKGDSALGEDGDGTGARDLCKQCHVQGG